ncbi:MAG: hypothetical protein ACFFA8_11835 [Promethearchaeota archaeon]
MNQKLILKYLKLFGLGFIIVSLIEFIDIILLSTVIRMNMDGDNLSLIQVLFNTGLITIDGAFLWIVLMIIPFIFIALGFILISLAKKENLNRSILSKDILLIGLFLLVGSFIKMVYIILLANIKLNLGITVELQQVMYNPLITPFIGAVMWIYIYGTTSGYLISGLIFGGVGLKWILIIEKEKPLKINDNSAK